MEADRTSKELTGSSGFFTMPLAAVMPEIVASSQPALIPGDGEFSSQWHLLNTAYPGVDLNVTSVWDDYTGRGVVVGVMDDGVDYNHPDLAPNYRHDLDYDARDQDSDAFPSASDDAHGTATSGVIAAAIGGGGAVGVAPDAEIAGLRIGFGGNHSLTQERTQLANFAGFDVVNNSWGYGGFYYDNFQSPDFAPQEASLRDAVASGRGGLGTVVTFAAGNSGHVGDDVNYHSYQSSRYTIAVGGINRDGSMAYFSTPGAAVLVSAGATEIRTTDRVGSAGYSSGDYVTINGTSFSAPAVAGVAALMLEANPLLGWRDVQEILAYSARNRVASNAGWQTNGATNWNGGGLTFSHAYGFGLVNAHAAVRLAETWQAQSTSANEITISGSSSPNLFISDNTTIADTITFSSGLEIDHVEVSLDIDHTWIGDISVLLTSPDGTTSTLVNRPGVSASSTYGASQDDINFTATSVAHWGETGVGTWTLRVIDHVSYDTGYLRDWGLTLYGDPLSDDNTYIYTDEYARHINDSAAETAGSSGTDGQEPGAGGAHTGGLKQPSFAVGDADYAANQVIVKLKPMADSAALTEFRVTAGASVIGTTQTLGIELWEFEGSFEEAASVLYDTGFFEYIEPNYTLSIEAEPDATQPNDPNFGSLWGLDNTGQSGGTADADIDAPEAWDLERGGNVVIGVIDTGVDYTHPDLAANIWTNPGEIAGNGIDDDGNGYIDDIHGYDFYNNDGDPFDDHSHGTHVSGTIAGDGNNGIGVTGVSWSANIMGLKFLSASGSGYTFGAVQALEYATMMGAQVTNNSWGGGGYSQSLYDAIAAAGNAGSLFVAAAGNSNTNTDSSPMYPAAYDLDNIISVAATTRTDARSYFSNYGASTVDLGAPGSSILSTVAGGGYATYSGTSMAAPHVTGVASLLWSYNPDLSHTQVKDAILASADPIAALDGITVTGGRLNAHAALLQAGDGGGGGGGGGSPGARGTLSDAAGTDTINAAAVTGNTVLDLTPGATSTIAGQPLVIAQGTQIENAFTGDGDDTLTGNDLANVLNAGRGNDVLSGGGGDDTLIGGPGDDTLSGGEGSDTAEYAGNFADYTLTYGANSVTVSGGAGTDVLTDVEFIRFADRTITTGSLRAIDDSLAASEDQALVIAAADLLANDDNPGDGALAISAVGNATGGTVALDGNGDVVFTPAADFSGAAGFDYTVTDGTNSSTASVAVAVTGVADTPALSTSPAAALEDAAIPLDISAALADTDGSETLSISIAGVPSGAVLSAGVDNGGGNWTLAPSDLAGLTLTPAANFNQDFHLTVTATATEADGDRASATSTLEVTITPVNDAPVAGADAVETRQNVTLIVPAAEILANDTDVDGDALAVTQVSNPVNGAVSFDPARGEISFTPAADFSGQAAFDVTVSDGNGGTATSTVTVDVTLTPTAGDDRLVGTEGNDTFGGAAGNDLLIGRGGNDTIFGGIGNDVLIGGAGADMLDGGAGRDRASYAGSAAGVTVALAEDGGTATGRGGDAEGDVLTGIEDLTGSSHGDRLVGNSAANRLGGGRGADVLEGGAGNDVYEFAPGDGADENRDRHYREQSYSYEETYTYFDTVTYTYGTWQYVGSGQDSYYQWVTQTGTRQEERTGTRLVEGTEIVHEDGGADVIAFGAGIAVGDVVLRLSGNDLVVGVKDPGNPDATFDALADKITIVGWADPKDRIERFRFADGTEVDISGLSSTLEALGDTAGVTLSGGGGQDWIAGGSGADQLSGGAGADVLSGGAGADALTGGAGNDLLDGGAGVDTAHYAGVFGDYTVSLDGAGATVSGAGGTDGLRNVERLAFSDVTIFADGTNNAPILAPDATATTEDMAVTIAASDLLANDVDVDGDTLTLSAVGNAAGGTVALDANGDVVFTPTADFSGQASFDYTVSDGTTTSTSTVTVEVTPVNDAPVAASDTAAASEDTPVTIQASDLLANDIDVDGDALSVVWVGNAVGGTVALDAVGDVVFTPTGEFSGQASFDYTASDGVATSTATVTVEVTPVNDPPVAAPDTAATLEDTPLIIAAANLLANDTDVEGHALTLTAVADGVGGTVALDVNGDVVFTPTANFNGQASFNYTVSDELGATSTGIVTVNVTAVDDAPTVAGSVSLTVSEDTSLTITTADLLVNASDPDGDILSVSNVAADTGTLIANADGTWTLVPDANFAGTITLTYVIDDGTSTVAAGATVEVTAVNDAPILAPDTAATTEDVAVTIAASDLLANDSDVDGGTLTLTAVGNAAGGTVGLDGNGDVVFTPTPDFNGRASFDYSVSDGQGGTSTSTVIVDVAAVNDAPVAAGGSFVASPGLTYSGILPATDVDGDALSIAVSTAPSHGTLAVAADGSFTYVPADGYFGPDSFTYTVSDPSGATSEGVVSVTVVSPGNLVVGDAANNTLIGTSGVDTLYGMGGNDTLSGGAGNDRLTGGTGADVINGGLGDDQYGFARGDGADTVRDRHYEEQSYSYQETYTYFDTVTYTYGTWQYVSSGQDGYYQWVTQTGTRQEERTGTRLVEGTEIVHEDAGVDVIAFGAGIAVGDVVLRLSGNDLVVGVKDPSNPDAAFDALADKITIVGWADPLDRIEVFRFADGTEVNISGLTSTLEALGDTAGVTLSGGGGQDWIVGGSGADQLFGGAGPDVLSGGAGDDTLTGGAGNDLLDGGAGVDTARYAGAYGDYIVTLDGVGATVSGAGGTDVLRNVERLAFSDFSITTDGTNNAPVLTPDSATTTEDMALTIAASDLLANDSDADGDTLTLTAVGNATGGTVALDANGNVVFTPTADFSGLASFDYTVSDGTTTSTSTVTVEVSAIADTPSLSTSPTAGLEDTAIPLAISAALSDTDGSETLSITIGGVPAGAGLSAGVDNGDGSWTLQPSDLAGLSLTPAADFNGAFDLTVTATAREAGGGTATSTATLGVTVAAVNDAPTAADANLVAPPGVPYQGVLPAADVDGDVLGYAIASAPAHGTVTLAANGGFTYVAVDGYFGSDGFTYTATDPSGASATGQVSLTVAAPGNLVIGDASANILVGTDADDTLIGLGGDDTLAGGAGDDWLMGGTGNDTIDGGPGNDRYRFQRGDGADNLRDRYYEERAFSYEETYTYHDTVSYTYETWEYVPSGQDGYYDWVTHTGTRQEERTGTRLVEGTEIVHEDGGADVIVFGAGIAAGDLELRLSGDDLIVGVRDPADPDAAFETLTDKLTLAGWAEPKDRIERFRFADGSEVEIASLSPAPAGSGDVGGADATEATSGDQATVASNLEAARAWFAREGDDPARPRAQGGAPPAGSNVENLVTAMAGFDPPDAGETGLAPDPQDQLSPTIAVDAYAGA